jgi:hypothetical protein
MFSNKERILKDKLMTIITTKSLISNKLRWVKHKTQSQISKINDSDNGSINDNDSNDDENNDNDNDDSNNNNSNNNTKNNSI